MEMTSTVVFAAILCLMPLVCKADVKQCYRCSYNVLKSEGLVGNILDLFNSVAADKSCKLDNDDDIYDIGIRNCPSEQGKVAKCSQIEGVVDTTVTFLDINVKYHTISRDCILVDPDDNDFADGCHDHLPSYGPVRTLLESALGGTEIGEVGFVGKACFRSMDKYTQEYSPLTSSANSVVSGHYSLCLVLLTALIKLMR